MDPEQHRLPDRPGDPESAAPGTGRGRRLGIDVGGVRIGVASSDPDGILATPVETVRRDRSGKHRSNRALGAGKVAAGVEAEVYG